MVIIMVKMGMIMVVVMAMIMVVVMMMAVDIRPLVHLGPHCQLIYSLNIILSCYKQENIFRNGNLKILKICLHQGLESFLFDILPDASHKSVYKAVSQGFCRLA